jgi:hypothetical protein
MFYPLSFIKRPATVLTAIIIATFLTACYEADKNVVPKDPASQDTAITMLDVYKNPACGCCKKWIEHIEKSGIQATIHNSYDLYDLKIEKGIEPYYQSCHTAISKDGYVFEGHIPVKYIQKFLQEKPEGAIGLTVPSMPLGSPGMEAGNSFTPYAVFLLMSNGSHKIYAQVKTQEEQY